MLWYHQQKQQQQQQQKISLILQIFLGINMKYQTYGEDSGWIVKGHFYVQANPNAWTSL